MADAAFFPRVHALLVCDEIQQISGQPSVFNLLGVRVKIRARHFPHLQPLLRVYMQMSGRQGTASCHVKVVEAATDSTLSETAEQQVPLEGPLRLIPVRWRIRRCSFPQPGLYYVQAYCGQQLLQERMLVLAYASEAHNGASTL